jgi:hypothetical protein
MIELIDVNQGITNFQFTLKTRGLSINQPSLHSDRSLIALPHGTSEARLERSGGPFTS